MKKLVLTALLCCLGTMAYAEEWLTDLPKALAQAKAEKKRVFMDFTGSDWCPPCIALHDRVLTKPEFEAYAKTNFVLVVVDFPEKKPQSEAVSKANEALKNKYQVDGFPTIIITDADGKELKRMEAYVGKNPKQFIEELEKPQDEKK